MSLKAFKTQVLPVKDKLYRFALRMVRSEVEAEDIVQEVLIRVWNKKEDMARLENVEAWCMRITKNLSLDRLKSSYVKRTDQLADGFDASIENEVTPYRSTEMKDTMKRVDKLIASLPEKQRQVIQLRDMEGYSYKEICDIMEIDMNQVKVNLFRARKTIKENLVTINAYGLG
ncbi:RNA polymerase sigma factor [Fulvivirga sp. M361]|uniref:RNA polymerase sigma factor n=1 Tax=Fulvivirga sp. M361 TaxID=2594266 RepID=UPI00117B62A5|nr:RNA polymerase sigma factor [Fulvivirga sp. M361]TRX62164.1 RNA polymerase sigma factor [Fulvivirga sp. M361]